MPMKQRAVTATQSLQHPFTTRYEDYTGTKVIAANNAGVIGLRPAKPVWLDVTWVQTGSVSEPFQIVMFGPGGEEISRSKPCLSSYTVQRMRLRAPPATDYGQYVTGNLVEIEPAATGGQDRGAIDFTFNFKVLYKPVKTTNIV